MRRTVNEALTPSPRLRITTPSKTWIRSFSPSTTLTDTRTVSPGTRPARSFFSCPASTMRIACMIRGSLLEIVLGRPALAEPRHPLLLFRREVRRLQQIPPTLPRPPDGHDALPPLDPGVIARAQHFRNGAAPEHLWARVLRMLEQAPRERIPRGRPLVAQGAGQKPRHRFAYDQRRRLAARQHVVADGQLLVHEMLAHPFVHALVAPAHQHEVRPLGELAGHLLSETAPSRVEQDDPRSRRPERLDARRERLGLQDHPAATPERRVVGHAVLPRSGVAQVMDADVHDPARARAPHDGVAERRLHHPGKERDDVDSHSSKSPSGGSMTIRRSATFTSTTISGTAGTRCSRPPSATTHSGWPSPPSPPP